MGYLLPLEPWIAAWEGGSFGALAGVVCIGQVRGGLMRQWCVVSRPWGDIPVLDMSWNIPIFIWGFPKMGYPQIIHLRLGFSIVNLPASSLLLAPFIAGWHVCRTIYTCRNHAAGYFWHVLVRRWHLLGCRCQFGFTLHGTAFAPSVHLDRLYVKMVTIFSQELLLRPYTFTNPAIGVPSGEL